MRFVVSLIVCIYIHTAYASLSDLLFDPQSDFNVFTTNKKGDTFGIVDCKVLNGREVGDNQKLFYDYGV